MSPKPLARRPLIPGHHVLPPEKYETIREHLLPAMFAAKRQRRTALGCHATLLFENRDIVLFHLHERLRAEWVTRPERRAAIVAEHERLLPRPFELRASLLIDGDDRRSCAQLAQRMAGPWSPVSLVVGNTRLRGDIFEPEVGPVHYLRFDIRTVMRDFENPYLPVMVGLAFDAGAIQTRLRAATCRHLLRDVRDGEKSVDSLYPFSKHFAWSDTFSGDNND